MRGIVIMTVMLAGICGGALAEERPDREPLERRYRRAPTRELSTSPRGRSADHEDSPDAKLDERHDKSGGRGDHPQKDDDDDD